MKAHNAPGTAWMPGSGLPASSPSLSMGSAAAGMSAGASGADPTMLALLDEIRGLTAEVKGLVTALQGGSEFKHGNFGKRVDVLSRIPPSVVTPVIQTGIVDYSNVLGAQRLGVAELKVPAGLALVVTHIKPFFWYLSAGSQPLTSSSPYQFIGGTGTGIPAHVFQVRIDGGLGAGEFSVRFRDSTAAIAYDVSGLIAEISVNELLSWESGLYRALVRGGGRFSIDSLVLAVIDAAGAVVPAFIGCEVGGYKAPEQIVMAVMNS